MNTNDNRVVKLQHIIFSRTMLMAILLLITVGLVCVEFESACFAAETDLLSQLPNLESNHVPANGLVAWSKGTSPTVAYALRKNAGKLALLLQVQTWSTEEAAPELRLAIAANREIKVTDKDATVVRDGKNVWYLFEFDPAQLVIVSEDWQQFRMAAQVQWKGGPLGQPRQIERFGTLDSAAPSIALPASKYWALVQLTDYIQNLTDNQRITLKIQQPMTGRWTVVLDDTQGRRVRTIVAGAAVTAGAQTLEWDGLDDFGRLVEPGKYLWRSLHHPGIRAKYQLAFANGDEPGLEPRLSNHGHFVAACNNAQYAFLAAPLTEGGCSLIAINKDGLWQREFRQVHGTGYHGVAIAADDRYFYAAHDGILSRERINKTTGKPVADHFISLTRYDIATGNIAPYSKAQFEQIETYDFGAGAEDPHTQQQISLTGMTLLRGQLYIASRHAQALLKVDPGTGRVIGQIALPMPGALASDSNQLIAVTDGKIVTVDPASNTLSSRIALADLSPAAMTFDDRGRIYVADKITHTVRLFNADGKFEGTVLGSPGGAYQGMYIPERMVNPCGLTIFAGRLWVTEDRVNPKRALAWDLTSKKIVVQKYGNPPYGAPGSGMDPQNPSLWLGMGCTWEVDFKTGAARCRSILQKNAGHLDGAIPLVQSYRVIRKENRTFLVGSGRATIVSELMPDGSARDLALFSAPHLLLYAMDWHRLEAFCGPFEKAFPNAKISEKYGNPEHRYLGVLWIDRNGDGIAQPEEFEFGQPNTRMAVTYWGSIYNDLTIRVPLTRADGSQSLVTLAPDGFLPGGAPNYPTLVSATAAALPLQEKDSSGVGYKNLDVSSLIDRFGNITCITDPFMVSFSPQGALRWQYPDRWSNVHGSHNAPLPSIGQMQGSLSFLGSAPLDDQSDVFVINGNHGRFFVMTTDGFYLDEMFRDVRMGGPNDDQHVGGEPFGGSFTRSEKDGLYYLQTGVNGFRIYKLEGLDQIKRQQGTITVEPVTLLALTKRAKDRQPAAAIRRQTVAQKITTILKIDGEANDWPAAATIAWDREKQFPVTVRCGFDSNNLYLLYDVRDDSPWLNHGKDWTTLFKTGDSVDLQIGTNPAAPASRREPVPGDLRLLVAPFGDKNIAVLYRYKLADKNKPSNPVTFNSPWRGVTVDSVERLDDVKIAVKTAPGGYRLEMAVPLKTLGLTPSAGPVSVDFGVLYGDAQGNNIALRSYWSNPFTGLVNDVPGEIMLHPDAWGVLKFGD